MEEGAKALSDIPAINRFLSYCRIRTVPSKTVIIHAGDLPDILYYIISGSVEVMIEDEEGNEMVLAYLNRGSSSVRWACSTNSPPAAPGCAPASSPNWPK
jgi:CRP/FNR family cyclic AMP-dependent transcriptional regulator